MTTWCMPIACWMPKAYKHSFRICNNFYFSTAKMVYERASMLRFTYIVCLLVLPFSSPYFPWLCSSWFIDLISLYESCICNWSLGWAVQLARK